MDQEIMRWGIYGGTFDPVHLGHLIVAEACREACGLDRVLWIPNHRSPHKQQAALTPGSQRVEMISLAIAGHPAFQVDRREIIRSGLSYTVETLRELHLEHPDDEFRLILGADSLRDFAHWREPREIIQLANLIVVNRGGEVPQTPEGLTAAIGEEACSRILFVSIPGIEISSSVIRQRIATGQSIRYLVPRAVEQYILSHHLYQAEITAAPKLS